MNKIILYFVILISIYLIISKSAHFKSLIDTILTQSNKGIKALQGGK
jgi:hypothetical protein